MSWWKSFWDGFTKPLPAASGDVDPDKVPRNFTPHAQQLLAYARKEADRFHHNFVGTEHLLLGLVRLGEGVGCKVLRRLGLNLETVRAEVEKQVGTGPDQVLDYAIPYTPRVKKVLALSLKEARNLNHTYVGTEHILLGMLREGDGVAGRVLKNLDVNIERTRNEILKELDFKSHPEPEIPPMEKDHVPEPIDVAKRYDVYCRDHHQEVVYRNARFKGLRTVFKKGQFDAFSDFMELEQANGETIFIGRHSIVRFCEHGVIPVSETLPDRPKPNPNPQ